MFIGFDRMFDQMFMNVNKTTYPPYNVEKIEDNEYKLSMAVAGFSSEDLTVTIEKNTLSICATKQEKSNCDYTWKKLFQKKTKRK